MSLITRSVRYSAVAILLHWTIALAILGNVVLGWWMHDAIDAGKTQAAAVAAFQLHKSLGLAVLVLSVFRLVWRLLHAPPPLPTAMPVWERFTAQTTHWLLYGFMIAIPLSGWLFVSTQWRGSAPLNVPTLWFGLFEVPHLFGLDEASHGVRQFFSSNALVTHTWLVWGAMALLALHVGAALKHHFLDRDEVLTHMLPRVRARDGIHSLRQWRPSLAVWMGGAGVLVSAIVLSWAVIDGPQADVSNAATMNDLPGNAWLVRADSEIVFSGVESGAPFQGRFTRWRASIQFDPFDPSGSSVIAEIETASAQDGNPMHEQMLTQREWFDVAAYPQATFRSTSFRPLGSNRFELTGTLTIKDRTLQLTPLTLSVVDDQLTIEAQVTIDRREANLGMESDPDAQYVSQEIAVTVRVLAEKSGQGAT